MNRGLAPQHAVVEGRELDYASLRAQHDGALVEVEWLESSEPSYLLYTSGATGKPKGCNATSADRWWLSAPG